MNSISHLSFRTLSKNLLIWAAICFLHAGPALSQDKAAGRTLRFTSQHTSFPDSAREQGHNYDSIHYSAKEHYHDSSVLLIVAKHYNRKRKLDLLFWFHGWNNNIDTANQFYEIEKQFLESGTNAVLVLAETAKNAPDSYGGRLERQGMFKQLVADVMNKLKEENIIDHSSVPGNIILAGHSGAYRVIAYVLANGEMPVAEVYLFDALYNEVDKFLSWIQQDQNHRFINWYTNYGGGTDEVSLGMMQQINGLHLPFTLVEESSVSRGTIRTNRILFVHSSREHNVIINNPENLKLILQNSVHLEH